MASLASFGRKLSVNHESGGAGFDQPRICAAQQARGRALRAADSAAPIRRARREGIRLTDPAARPARWKSHGTIQRESEPLKRAGIYTAVIRAKRDVHCPSQ